MGETPQARDQRLREKARKRAAEATDADRAVDEMVTRSIKEQGA
ncbi:hypothetical protein GCM10022276_19910 [Sphingomonas limnosediminicola]|uniref:Uncharacterized protein n=1 Tax=Sphingomonas limnosediminicola TaxID=940133 RepID=A0ABP7LG05_9SPHN